MALFFYITGYIVKTYKIQILQSGLYNKLSAFSIFLMPIIILTSYINPEAINMYLNSYGNLFLFFIAAFSGIGMVIYYAQKLEENKVLAWIGKNSITFYIFQFSTIKIIHGIGKKVFPFLEGKNYLYPYYWGYFVIEIIVLSLISIICNRYFWYLFGKNRVQSKKKNEGVD